MIDKKYQGLVFSFFMAMFMSGVMSLVITTYNVGLVENITFLWLKSWGFSFIVAFPATVTVSPLVHVIVALVIKHDG